MSLLSLPALGALGAFYAVLTPLFLMQVIALLFIPSMIVHGAKPRQVGRAVYCYILQTLGILLLTAGAMPALYGVLTKQPYDSKMYLTFLIIFVAGGLTFLWHDNLLRTVDDASRAVPESVYRSTFKLIGYASVLFSVLWMLLNMLLNPALPTHWWAMPSLWILYGVLLSWCTRDEMKQSFQAYLLNEPPHRPAHPVTKKAASKKKN